MSKTEGRDPGAPGTGRSTGSGIAPPGGRLRSIDFLRGIAALSVVLHHAINFGWGQNMPMQVRWFRWLHAVVDRGDLGVPLFFVISGFCIHMSWARARAMGIPARIGFADFWRRRLHRLYPPYLVMLVLSMALLVAAALTHRSAPLLARYPEPRAAWIGFDFLAHALMLHGFHPIFDQGGGNAPFWTLAREEYLYALYFVLLAWRRSWGVLGAAAAVLAASLVFPAALQPILARVEGGADWWPLVRTSAISLWIQWTLGMVAVEGYFGLLQLPKACSWIALVPAWAALALLAERGAPLLVPALWGMCFFTLLNSCVGVERRRGWPARGVAAWLTSAGVFSYSIYLAHVPARAVMKQLLGKISATADPGLYVALAALFASGGYLAGRLFFLLVERRFLNRPGTPPTA